MAGLESTFLLEVTIEKLTTFFIRKLFHIEIQFSDIFNVNLKDPNKDKLISRSQRCNKGKDRAKKSIKDDKSQTVKSILFHNKIDKLIELMRKYPIELSLWTKINPKRRVASTHISWNWGCLDFLKKIENEDDTVPAFISVQGEYNLFDEYSSKRMGVIHLNLKLSNVTSEQMAELQSQSYRSYASLYSELICMPPKPKSSINLTLEPGIIKTTYYGPNKRSAKKRNRRKKDQPQNDNTEATTKSQNDTSKEDTINHVKLLNRNLIPIVKSETSLYNNKEIVINRSKSCSTISKNNVNILNYVFNEGASQFGNRVYCVGYFTVENSDKNRKTPSEKSSGKSDASKKSKDDAPETPERKDRFKFKICDSALECNDSECSVSIPDTAAPLITVKKCEDIMCEHKKLREEPPSDDTRILLDLGGLRGSCCRIEKTEEVVVEMKTQVKVEEKSKDKTGDECYCDCECKFGFVKRTTYCKICGGYERAGEELTRKLAHEMPFPCPIYHNLLDKKPKPVAPPEAKSKCIEFEKKGKKGRIIIKDDRFKFNYGYSAPQIGHSNCTAPCTGTLSNVPKKMGWLWTSDNVPGLKYRPLWRPGAISKHVVRLLRIAKNPEAVMKRRRRFTGNEKKQNVQRKRPLLVVHKQDGEYTVTMETMKNFTKPRMSNQYPYEDKPVVTYTIGRTEQENLERRKKKERAKRRLERAKRAFLQSTFKNVCHEICMKTYHQALGMVAGADIPDCPCFPTEPKRSDCDLSQHSCSCSEDDEMTDSEFTDSDEWVVEFTPPSALFDQTYKGKKIACSDSATQYSYLDYRVKLLDRYGNEVPRFFKGLDGKQHCSDLGGFYGPDKKWLDINIDGYIGPDGRWAPSQFIGPNNELVDADIGKFQIADGRWLVVGVDGYVDAQNKWRYYPKQADSSKKNKPHDKKAKVTKKRDEKSRKEKHTAVNSATSATWSCFGDASPKDLNKMGIVGHGHDKKVLLNVLQTMMERGDDVSLPAPPKVPTVGRKKKRAQNKKSEHGVTDRLNNECKHSLPSRKGVIVVNDHGRNRKAYFSLKDPKNKRPQERVATLSTQGISVTSFHLPCFHSFISSEQAKKEKYEKLRVRYEASLANKGVVTQP